MDNLRKKVIRLAHSKPALRSHLLPLLGKTRTASDIQKVLKHFQTPELMRMVESPRAFLHTVTEILEEYLQHFSMYLDEKALDVENFDFTSDTYEVSYNNQSPRDPAYAKSYTEEIEYPSELGVGFEMSWDLDQFEDMVQDIEKKTRVSKLEIKDQDGDEMDLESELEDVVESRAFIKDFAALLSEKADSDNAFKQKHLIPNAVRDLDWDLVSNLIHEWHEKSDYRRNTKWDFYKDMALDTEPRKFWVSDTKITSSEIIVEVSGSVGFDLIFEHTGN